MRKPKMKRRGEVDLVIAIGGSPTMGKKKPHKHGEEEECPCGMPGCPGCDEAEGQEEGAYGPGDKSIEYHEERMDLMEERLARIEAMIAGDEEDEEDDESNHNSNSDDSY